VIAAVCRMNKCTLLELPKITRKRKWNSTILAKTNKKLFFLSQLQHGWHTYKNHNKVTDSVLQIPV